MLDPRRAAAIAEAETWLGTRYHHMGRVKGAGVDCLMLLAEVYAAAGVIDPVPTGPGGIPHYPPDFMLHQSAELYLEGLLKHAREVAAPGPGDVAIFKWGRVFAHAGIVTLW